MVEDIGILESRRIENREMMKKWKIEGMLISFCLKLSGCLVEGRKIE